MLNRGLILKYLWRPYDCKPKHELFPICMPNQLKINNSLNTYPYIKKLSYNFSYKSGGRSKRTDINYLKQIYSRKGPDPQFYLKYIQIIDKYGKSQDWLKLLQIYDALLKEVQKKQGIKNINWQHQKQKTFEVQLLINWIHLASGQFKQKNLKQIIQRINLLYDKLTKNQIAFKLFYVPRTDCYRIITEILIEQEMYQEAIKWASLFKNYFKDFDKTNEIEDKDRFHVYQLFAHCYQKLQRKQEQLENYRKAYDLFQKGADYLSEQDKINLLHYYGTAEFKYGSKDKGIKVLRYFEQNQNLNTFVSVKAAVQVCRDYFLGKQFQRAETLYDLIIMICQHKKTQKQYKFLLQKAMIEKIKVDLHYHKQLNALEIAEKFLLLPQVNIYLKLQCYLLKFTCQYFLDVHDIVDFKPVNLTEVRLLAQKAQPSDQLIPVLAIIETLYRLREIQSQFKCKLDQIKHVVQRAIQKNKKK